jgi:cytoskeleton protein RodZ
MSEARAARVVQPKRVGERIAEARVALKLELEDIAERSRIPMRHLQAIEESNFEVLPASTYSIGFAKTFARMVGLDGEQIAADFRAERGEMLLERSEYTPFEPADPSRIPPSLLAMVAIGTAVILLVAYLIWRGGGKAEERQQMAAGTLPEVSAPATPGVPAPRQPVRRAAPAPAPLATDKVVLTASDAAWVKISEKNGPMLFIGEMAPGQRYEVPATAVDPRILTGRPDVLSATVGTRVIASLGSVKRSINDVSLKGPALIERDTAMKAAAAATAAATAGTPESNSPAPAVPDQPSAGVATPPAP